MTFEDSLWYYFKLMAGCRLFIKNDKALHLLQLAIDNMNPLTVVRLILQAMEV